MYSLIIAGGRGLNVAVEYRVHVGYKRPMLDAFLALEFLGGDLGSLIWTVPLITRKLRP